MADATTPREREKLTLSNKLTLMQIGVSALLAIVGLLLTWTQFVAARQRAETEQANKRFEAFVTLGTKCQSDQPGERDAMLQIVSLINKVEGERGVQTGSRPLIEFKPFSDLCSQLATQGSAAVVQGQAPPPAKASAATPSGPATWVYLGTYQNGVWQTRYLDFPTTFNPSTYQSGGFKKFGVNKTGALNVRTGDFSPTGAFPPVTSSLAVGRQVRLLETWQWGVNSGNWWAKVEVL